jgi:hypothetical protein
VFKRLTGPVGLDLGPQRLEQCVPRGLLVFAQGEGREQPVHLAATAKRQLLPVLEHPERPK